MDDVQYLTWLRELEAGNEIAFARTSMGGTMYEIYTVERITPTQIVTYKKVGYQTAARFNRKDGRIVGGSSWRKIEPVTDAVRDVIELIDLRDWLYRTERAKTPLNVMRAMKKAYDEASK